MSERLRLITINNSDNRLDATQNGAVVEQGVGLHHQITAAIAKQGDAAASYTTDATIATATARNTRQQGNKAARRGESALPFNVLAGITDATAAIAKQRASLAKTVERELKGVARKTGPLHQVQRAQRDITFKQTTRQFAYQDVQQEIGRTGLKDGLSYRQLDENFAASKQAMEQRVHNLKGQIANGLRESRRPRAQVPPIIRSIARAAGDVQGETDARIKTAASETERTLITKELPLPKKILRRIRF